MSQIKNKRKLVIYGVLKVLAVVCTLIVSFNVANSFLKGYEKTTTMIYYYDRTETHNDAGSSYYLYFVSDLYPDKPMKVLVTKGYYDSARPGYKRVDTGMLRKFYPKNSWVNYQDNINGFTLFVFAIIAFCRILVPLLINIGIAFENWLERGDKKPRW